MTVATLLLTSLIFLSLGWVSPSYRVVALSIAGIVCIAAAVGGTTSQDLKTGYLIGATPRAQQIAIIVGTLASAIVIGFTIKVLNDASTIYSKKNLPNVVVPNVSELVEREKVNDQSYPNDTQSYRVLHVTELSTTGPLAGLLPGKYLVNDTGAIQYIVDPGINGALKTRDDGSSVQKYEAPKARLMSLIIDGILTQKLPWIFILIGASITIMMELCGVSSLAFAAGVYLPMAVTTPIFVGGTVRWLVDRVRKGRGEKVSEEDSDQGTLFSSGLIAGGSIAGIGLALLALNKTIGSALDIGSRWPSLLENNWLAVGMFAILIVALFSVANRKSA
jgi:uncharacterized oligopeptide transporter (OPT) family protein